MSTVETPDSAVTPALAKTRKLESIQQLDREVAAVRVRADAAIRLRETFERELNEARAERAALDDKIRGLQEDLLNANRTSHVVLNELDGLLRVQERVHARAATLAAARTDDPQAAAQAPAVGPNQRRAPRAPLAVDVTLDSETNFYLGFSENISSGGIFVATHHTRPVGERFPLEFALRGHDDKIVCMVEVAWVREPDGCDEHQHGMPGLGLRFVGIDAAAIAAIEQFTATREALFFPEFDEYDVLADAAAQGDTEASAQSQSRDA